FRDPMENGLFCWAHYRILLQVELWIGFTLPWARKGQHLDSYAVQSRTNLRKLLEANEIYTACGVRQTQLQAFRDIVTSSLSFLVFGYIFSMPSVWRAQRRRTPFQRFGPSYWCPDEEWTFWKTFAATCLSNTTISAILVTSSIPKLTSCEEGRLSVVEKLLVEYQCS
ncbi:hypothetical protein B0H13DRAFT_1953783, partial [Mycena leptocephala]